jgi:hypothetical protein
MYKTLIVAVFALLALPVQSEETSLQNNERSRVQLETGQWVAIGSTEPYIIADAVLCQSPELAKELVDLDFLAGHFPSGCGPYVASRSKEGAVAVILTYLENYDSKAVIVEFDPVEPGLRSFYGCLRLRQSVAWQAI